MKKITAVTCGLLLSLSSLSLANKDFTEYNYIEKPLNITIQISDIKSHSDGITDKQCQFQVKKEYQVYTNKKSYDIGDDMKIKMHEVYMKEENRIITVKGEGIWTGISPTDGKVFADLTHFVGVGLKNSGEICGVFSDDYCEAKFKGSFTN